MRKKKQFRARFVQKYSSYGISGDIFYNNLVIQHKDNFNY